MAQDDALDQAFLLGLVGHSARLASSGIRPLFTQRMAGHDLRQAEFAVLSLLEANPSISQKRLADAINVSPPNMAAVLARLLERDLIRRERQPSDQRMQILLLTPAGTRLYRKAAATALDLDQEATAMLTPAERRELLRLLKKVNEAQGALQGQGT
ncbi:MAG: hypothetical protein ABS43_00290 [Bordetella sp. SCN 67-23]|nr:MarR family transcriptional regulator [Burkholderiales bacterium]ODS76632.1 MAG: hypothetical protein ABS43_00290 [Bordetella sp. SCN 67-23]ODU95621.1 MAG: hypothetical protein ABT00_03510 [Bordetella sp. SCN 68-11]OJW93754.1 MAG: hypothetical protein BGO71_17800 [Burkholderiales bacterium 67-32]